MMNRLLLPRLGLSLALMVCLATPAIGAERAVLRDGRDLLFQTRQAVEGGWLLGLHEGGAVLLSAMLVERFEAVRVMENYESPLELAGVTESNVAPSAELIPEMIKRISTEFSVDPKLVEAVIQVESGFDKFAVSPKGAGGLMQLMPGTAERLKVGDVFDPVENIRGGVRYLKELSERFGGDLGLVLAAYNAGEKAVERHVGIPPYRETQRYVIRVLELYLHGKP